MARSSRESIVQAYLEAQVAFPISPLLDSEREAIQRAINIALVSYWQAFPYTYRDTFTSSIKGSLGFRIDDIIARVFPGNTLEAQRLRDSAYFLGISSIEPGPMGGYGTNIDSYLLGVPFSDSPSLFDSVYTGGLDYRRMLLDSTEMDMLTGEVSVEFDPVGNISLITPSTYTQFQITFAFGFSESASLKYIPYRQIDLFRKMAAVEFLDIVIKARSQVTISADSSLNVSSLQERRNELKAEVAKQTADEMLYPISWG
jgi:hypothetical protein